MKWLKWNNGEVVNTFAAPSKIEYNDKDRIDYELENAKPTNTKTDEIWKDVIGYERWYEVSNYGNVRKINRDGTTKVLKAKDNVKGRTVGLRKVNELKTFSVSHLVANAFKLKTTEKNKKRVYHIDGNVNNDCLSNLTYDFRETETYIKEHEEEIKENKLQIVKETTKEITLEDIYDKLNELIDVIKRK